MINLYTGFTNMYPIQKTLRFELKPVGKTLENIEEKGYISEGEKRAKDYQIVKKVIDRYHVMYIEDTLKDVHLEGLDDYMVLYCKRNRGDDDNKRFLKIQDSLRKQVVSFLENDIRFVDLFKEKLIKDRLGRDLDLSEKEAEAVESFKNFTTFFKGFHENRKNMYVDEKKSTAICYRLIDQNLPKFVDNIIQYKKFEELDSEGRLSRAEENYESNIGQIKIKDCFDIDYFDYVLNQAGIDKYNYLVGELNRHINEFNQKLGSDNRSQKIGKLKVLYKQILSDRSESPFSIDAYETDEDVIKDIITVKNNSVAALNTVNALLENIESYDMTNIYIPDKYISDISQKVFGDYEYLNRFIPVKKGTFFTLDDIEQSLPEESKNKLIPWLKSQSELIRACCKAQDKLDSLGLTDYSSKKDLASDKKTVSIIKEYLDSVLSVIHLIKMFIGYDGIKDEVFYGDLSTAYMILDQITPVYNMTRNYVTRKPYSTKKVKLNFSKGTFLDGWDVNKEPDNLGTILLKDDKYYLAVIDRSNSKVFENIDNVEEEDAYLKMEYKLLPGPNKMLPKVFFANSNIDYYNPSGEILRIKHDESFKKGANFNINDCHKFIDFYKQSILIHPDWKHFGFKFKETSEYADISEFYKEVAEQGYKITYRRIKTTDVDALIDEGKIHLFQIYNKDFSSYSKGTPNLHTLYWKMLFNPENLADVVYKLNGEAEVFYRKLSISNENIIVHPANAAIINKNPENTKSESTFEYDIIKDRRYTVDKLQFHVPITMNFKASGRGNINEEVNHAIKYGGTPYVIGIDRGERHLLYVTVINPKGEIVEQFSLNEIVSNGYKVNYHNLLESKEKERQSARKDWNTIGTIKELKDGYMSQVIHVITDLMKKYNAIIVLEDLNQGFKRGRQKVEKQVYQKFEKNLIDKLNYYVDKAEPNYYSESGLLRAYQLTNKFESFTKLGKQSGVLLYIPAWNTSKLDPTTGFVNLFYTKYESVSKAKYFWSRFKSISYNGDYFEFEVDDYSKFTDKAIGCRKNWTICSYGERIKSFRNKNKNNSWDNEIVEPTKMLIETFNKYEIEYRNGNLVEAITSKNEKDFFVELFYAFKLIVQMRNSITGTDTDYMISPVRNKSGEFYDSRKADSKLPNNADANGAFNIARKGLMAVEQIKATDDEKIGKVKFDISNKAWLDYAQKNC